MAYLYQDANASRLLQGRELSNDCVTLIEIDVPSSVPNLIICHLSSYVHGAM